MTINIEYRDTRMKRLHCRVFGHDPRKLETIHVCRRCHGIVDEPKGYAQLLRKLFLIKYKLKYGFYKLIRLKIDCVGNHRWLWFKWTPKWTAAYHVMHDKRTPTKELPVLSNEEIKELFK